MDLTPNQLLTACNASAEFRQQTSENAAFIKSYLEQRTSPEYLGVPGSYLWLKYRLPDGSIDYVTMFANYINYAARHENQPAEIIFLYCLHQEDIMIKKWLANNDFTCQRRDRYSDPARYLVECALTSPNDKILDIVLELAMQKPKAIGKAMWRICQFLLTSTEAIEPYQQAAFHKIQAVVDGFDVKELALLTSLSAGSLSPQLLADNVEVFGRGDALVLAVHSGSISMVQNVLQQFQVWRKTTSHAPDRMAEGLLAARRLNNTEMFKWLVNEIIASKMQLDDTFFYHLGVHENSLFADWYVELLSHPANVDGFMTWALEPTSDFGDLRDNNPRMQMRVALLGHMSNLVPMAGIVRLFTTPDPHLEHTVKNLEIVDAMVSRWSTAQVSELLTSVGDTAANFVFTHYIKYLQTRQTATAFQWAIVGTKSKPTYYRELGVPAAGRSSHRNLVTTGWEPLLTQVLVDNRARDMVTGGRAMFTFAFPNSVEVHVAY